MRPCSSIYTLSYEENECSALFRQPARTKSWSALSIGRVLPTGRPVRNAISTVSVFTFCGLENRHQGSLLISDSTAMSSRRMRGGA